MFTDDRTYIRFNKTWDVDVPIDGRMFVLYGTASVPEGYDIRTSREKIVPMLRKVMEADPTPPGSRWPWGRPHKIKDEAEVREKYRDIFLDALTISLEDELTPEEERREIDPEDAEVAEVDPASPAEGEESAPEV